VVVVVVVDEVLVVVGVAAIAEGAKNLRDFSSSLLLLLTELQLWKRHLADVRGCIPRLMFCTLKGTVEGATFHTVKGTVVGVLQMLEDAIIGETTSVAKTGGSPPHT
jgi:hypothetical protein